MTVYIDELTLAVKGNLVKKFDGSTSTLRVTRNQLDELAKVVTEAQGLFNGTQPSPPEEPKTKEAADKTPSGG